MKLSDEDMEKLCDMLKGVYEYEEHCIYHDGIIYLDDIVKCADFIKEHQGTMTDEQLKAMSKADANASLSRSDMHRWVQLHNATANCYFIKNGKIEDVEPAGWWY